MTTVAQQLRGLPQLLRIKPVMSWGVSAFLLGVAVAVARTGETISVTNGVLALLLVVIVQGVISHGLNDAYDWLTGTDRDSIAEGTGGSRVIPQGKMTVAGTIGAAVGGIIATLVIGGYFITEFGLPMVALIFVALWSSIAYSTPPLKLGYRPFSELTVVLPALVGVVVGTDLVLSGSWSWLAVGVGFIHAMFCISWFIVSRIPDYEPDKAAGKTTTVVLLGRPVADSVAIAYVGLGLLVAVVMATVYSPLFYGAFVWGAIMVYNLHYLRPTCPQMASDIRSANMRQTTYHAVALAVLLAGVGV